MQWRCAPRLKGKSHRHQHCDFYPNRSVCLCSRKSSKSRFGQFSTFPHNEMLSVGFFFGCEIVVGTSAGVGFAIPVDTVAKLVPQIIAYGKVSRNVLIFFT